MKKILAFLLLPLPFVFSCTAKKGATTPEVVIEAPAPEPTPTPTPTINYSISLLINGGVTGTTSTASTLTLTSDNSPTEMYVTQDSSCSSGGSWEAFATSKSWTLQNTNANNVVYFKVRGPYNESSCVNAQITHDDQPPTGNSIVVNDGNSHTGSLNVSLTLMSTGAAQMYITNTAACGSGGSWETFNNGKSWTLPNADASNTVYAKFRDTLGNESSCMSDSIVHDSLLPNLTIDSPAANSYANGATQGAFTISGSCGATGRNVVMTGSISRTLTCSGGGTWSTTEDLTALGEGSFSVTVNHSNAAGNPAPAVTRSFTKDTIAPTATSLAINGGAAYVNSTSVTLTPAATGAAQMYVTNTAGCASGGTNETYATTRAWTLPSSNATNTVYAKYTDAAGNVSGCVSASTIHDGIAPTIAISSPAAASYIYSGNVTAFTMQGSCSENTRTITFSGAMTGTTTCGTGSPNWSYTGNAAAASEGSVSVTVSITDVAGNTTTASRSFTKDTIAPTSTSITINGGAAVTSSPSVTANLVATGANQMYVTEDSDCATGSTYETYATSKAMDLTQEEGNVYVYVKYRDVAQNETACLSAGIILDSSAPVWADIPFHGNALNSTTSSPLVIYDESASDAESGVEKYQYAIGTSKTGANQANVKGWTDVTGGTFTATGLSLSNGITYYVNMRAIDYAGNDAYVSSNGWVVDNLPPSLSLTSHVDNQFTSESDLKLMGSCESPYTVNISFGTNMSGSTTTPCTSNTFIAYVSFSGSSGNRSYSLSQTDAVSNTTTLNLNFTYQTPLEIAGTVLAATQLSDDSVVYGGNFQSVTTARDLRLIRLNTDGTKDTGFNVGSGFNGQILAIAELGDGSVIVGGDFTTYRARPALRIAKIDSSGTLDTTFNPTIGSNGFNGVVRAIAVSGSDIFVGGDFTTYRGSVANRVAKVGSTGTLDTSFNPGSGANGANNRIRAIAISGSAVYLGGEFTTYRGGAAVRVAKIDTSGNLDTTFNPASGANGVNGLVRALVATSDTVYVGGDFTTYQGAIANRIAKVSSSGALDTTFSPQTGGNGISSSSSYVYSIALSGSDLYIAGNFTKYRGTAAANTANRVAKLNATSGAMDTTFNPSTSTNNGTNNTVSGVAVLGTNIYFGGSFTTYRSGNATRIAKVSTAGAIDTTFNPTSGANGFNNTVNALFSTGTKLYVGGYFASYRAGTIARNIVKLDSSGNVDTTFSPQSGANGTDNVVRALTTDGTNVFAGGDFLNYRGTAVQRIVKIGANGVIDPDFVASSAANGIVRALYYEPIEGFVYVGGDFTSWAGNVANRVTKVHFENGSVDATNFSPGSGGNGANGSVRAITAIGQDIYIAGAFTTYRGSTVNRIVKTNALGERDTAFNPATGTIGLNNTPYALTNDGTNVYVGGTFTTYRGAPANRIAKLDSSGNLDTVFNPGTGANGFNSYVYALDYLSSNIYVGGSFTRWKSTGIANYVAKISTAGVLDTTVSPQSGANGTSGGTATVQAISVKTGALYLGGAFTTYRGRPANSNVKLSPSSGAQIP